MSGTALAIAGFVVAGAAIGWLVAYGPPAGTGDIVLTGPQYARLLTAMFARLGGIVLLLAGLALIVAGIVTERRRRRST